MSRPKYPIKRYVDILSHPKENRIGASIVATIKQMLMQLREKKRLTKDRVVVGYLDDEIVTFLEKQGIPVHTKEIYLNHKGLSHLARDTKSNRGAGLMDDDIFRIPEILKSPTIVIFDNHKNKLNPFYAIEKSNSLLSPPSKVPKSVPIITSIFLFQSDKVEPFA